MNHVRSATWVLKCDVGNSDIVELTRPDFQMDIDLPITTDMTVYDQFDAVLLNADYTLCRVGKQRFQLIHGLDCIGEVQSPAKSRFWWDFPDGEVRDRLKSLIGLRAVLPVTSLRIVQSHFILRNTDDKIVTKGQLLRSIADDDVRNYLILQGMRGYDKPFAKARRLLVPVLSREVPEFGLRTVLYEQGLVPANNRSINAVHLRPEMPTEEAVRVRATSMIHEALRHVDGVVADVDTVFLHQFRISIRKLRSLVSLLRQSLPPATVDAVVRQLSSIAKKTGRLRDLDVFLLEKDRYWAMLPETHRIGLDELFKSIAMQRHQERARLARYFRSWQFQRSIACCIADLSAEPVYLNAMSTTSVSSTAGTLVARRYRKIQGMSNRLDDHSVDEDVHNIRKELKKLRYLLEFFIEQFPVKRTTRLMSRLKKMQATLGEFNDYCVQIKFLSGFSDDKQVELTKSLSGLLVILHHHQLESRRQVHAAVTDFFTGDMTREVELVFDSKSNRGS